MRGRARMGTDKGVGVRTHAAWLPCGLLLFLLGCGGSPTTPSTPVPPPTPILQPGAYYFLISQGSNTIPAPVGGGTLNTWICMGVGSYPTSVQIPVMVQGDGASYQARAVSGSLLLTLTVSGSAARGTLQGNADDGTGGFALSVQGTEPASISGSVTSEHTASGSVVGSISLIGPQGGGSCSPANWSLTAR